MSTLMVDFIVSLDGYGAAEGWPSFWGLEGPEYLAWLGENDQEGIVHLMGANTYRVMERIVGASQDAASDALTRARKVVFSSTLTAPLSWSNSELVSTDAVAAVRELKEHETRRLCTLGSLGLSRSLLAAGLVDRFRVVVFPVITGATGREPIFANYPDLTLELVESRTFDGRLQLLEYVPTVLDGPPTAR
ncbi:dihydrofolate reductase family protein [Pseudonocardia sp. TRM90224]|uniref:dihydrofolate reductase family protein n=1 Tax=Pseudonocardia sp. TRM90224 TaxID=2812678 RepID=UPI001E3AAA4C|nr:dihydrofolate reductase family protein [Pseudonocardia sp. TRM90224]